MILRPMGESEREGRGWHDGSGFSRQIGLKATFGSTTEHTEDTEF
jgi:hypothetical protein